MRRASPHEHRKAAFPWPLLLCLIIRHLGVTHGLHHLAHPATADLFSTRKMRCFQWAGIQRVWKRLHFAGRILWKRRTKTTSVCLFFLSAAAVPLPSSSSPPAASFISLCRTFKGSHNRSFCEDYGFMPSDLRGIFESSTTHEAIS